jgi:hypothetical protein
MVTGPFHSMAMYRACLPLDNCGRWALIATGLSFEVEMYQVCLPLGCPLQWRCIRPVCHLAVLCSGDVSGLSATWLSPAVEMQQDCLPLGCPLHWRCIRPVCHLAVPCIGDASGLSATWLFCSEMVMIRAWFPRCYFFADSDLCQACLPVGWFLQWRHQAWSPLSLIGNGDVASQVATGFLCDVGNLPWSQASTSGWSQIHWTSIAPNSDVSQGLMPLVLLFLIHHWYVQWYTDDIQYSDQWWGYPWQNLVTEMYGQRSSKHASQPFNHLT